MMAMVSSRPILPSELWKAWAWPWNWPSTAGGNADLVAGLVDGAHRVAEGIAGGEIEGDRHRRKLAQMIDRQRHGARRHGGDGAERHQRR